MIPERDIIKALADNRLRVTQAAEAVYLNPNSMRYRVESIHKKTGLDPLDFWDMRKLVNRYGIECETPKPSAIDFMLQQLCEYRRHYEKRSTHGAKRDELDRIADTIDCYNEAIKAMMAENARDPEKSDIIKCDMEESDR